MGLLSGGKNFLLGGEDEAQKGARKADRQLRQAIERASTTLVNAYQPLYGQNQDWLDDTRVMIGDERAAQIGMLDNTREQQLAALGAGYDQGAQDVRAGTLAGMGRYDQGLAEAQALYNPYVQMGSDAAGRLSALSTNANAAMMADPSYQWRLAEGQKALQNSAAAQRVGLSANTLMGLSDYNQGAASQEYANIFQRQQQLAAMGEAAAAQQAGASQWARGGQAGLSANEAAQLADLSKWRANNQSTAWQNWMAGAGTASDAAANRNLAATGNFYENQWGWDLSKATQLADLQLMAGQSEANREIAQARAGVGGVGFAHGMIGAAVGGVTGFFSGGGSGQGAAGGAQASNTAMQGTYGATQGYNQGYGGYR